MRRLRWIGGAVAVKSRLTEAGFKEAADSLGVDIPSIKAVAEIESRGAGFLQDGRPRILFERHKFHKYTQGLFSADHPDISNPKAGGYSKGRTQEIVGQREHDRFEKAYALDPMAAMKSASWGKFQIMGFNYDAAGFGSVHDFVEAMKVSEDEHLKAFVNFVKSNGLTEKLRRRDWAGFARGYNGVDYKINQYDTKLAAAYRKYSKLQPAEIKTVIKENTGDTVTLKSTTESASGEVTTETKKIAMTETSPTAKRLTLGAVITAAIGFIQQAWQTSQEATVSGIQFLMKRMPMVLLILGILLFAYWIWKKSQESRDARLELIVDTNTDKAKDDVLIV